MPDTQTIIYPDSFFSDVVNFCNIADYKEETISTIQLIYNTFKNAMQMDKESRIEVCREKMLCLDYYQLFMHLLGGMHMYYMFHYKTAKPRSTTIEETFLVFLQTFNKFALKVRHHPKDEETWTNMEIASPSVRDDVWYMQELIADFCFHNDITSDHKKVMRVPEDFFDDDDEDQSSPDLEKKLDDIELQRIIEVSRIKSTGERLYLFGETCINVAIFVGYMFFISRIWVAILSTDPQYRLGVDMFFYVFTLFGLQIVNNTRTIFKFIRRLAGE